MRILIACEFSGIVRDAFISKGHDAVSCDLLPTDRPGPHFQGDVLEILNDGWDMMIAHPPCTYFTVAGTKALRENPGRIELQKRDALFVKSLWEADIHKICIENPVGYLPEYIGPYSQITRMWKFGHNDAHKPTCFWLKNLPPLFPTKIVEPIKSIKCPNGKYASQWYSKRRKPKDRSRTFQGIADAMANQWG